jgi:hypothetical protein
MREIVGNQDEVVHQRRCRDQDISIIDDRALSTESREDPCSLNHDLIAQGKHDAVLAPLIEGLDLAESILRHQAAKDLVAGDDGELEPLVKAEILLGLTLCGEVAPFNDF